MKLRQTQNITNEKLTTWDPDVYFPIWRDGKLDNKQEFIEYKMGQYNLKTPRIVLRALQTLNIE